MVLTFKQCSMRQGMKIWYSGVYLTKFHSRCVRSQSSKSAGSEWTQRHQSNQCTSTLKIINSKKCYGNDTNPELGKSNNNIKCGKKWKLDQAFVVHLQELSLLIRFKLTFFIILLYSTLTWKNYTHYTVQFAFYVIYS